MRFSWRSVPILFATGLVVYFLAIRLGTGWASGLRIGMAIGASLAAGLAMGLSFGMGRFDADLRTAGSPRATLMQDRRTALAVALLGGLPVGLVTGLACTYAFGSRDGLAAGLAASLTAGLAISGFYVNIQVCLAALCLIALRD